jgi:hypothetical protein
MRSRIAADYTVWLDILCHHTARINNCTLADRHTGQDQGMREDTDIVTDDYTSLGSSEAGFIDVMPGSIDFRIAGY